MTTPSNRVGRGDSQKKMNITTEIELPKISKSVVDKGGDEGDDERLIDDNSEYTKGSPEEEWAKKMLFYFACLILFTQWVTVTAVTSYFPQFAEREGISSPMVGLIVAIHPGGVVLASLLLTPVINIFGDRDTIMYGLVIGSFTILFFGLVPYALSPNPTLWSLAFIILRFINGFATALAETACVSLVSIQIKDGKVAERLATLEVMAGLGTVIGPALGGFLYEMGLSSPFGDIGFAAPCLLLSAVPAACGMMLVSPQMACVFRPNSEDEEDEVPYTSLLKSSIMWKIVHVLAGEMLACAVEPILPPFLEAAPFNFSESRVGLAFAVTATVYMVGALPVGRATDTLGTGPLPYNTMLGVGFWLYALGYWMISGTPSSLVLWTSLIVMGGGSALTQLPTLPAMQAEVGDNDAVVTAITGIWSAAYAAGSMLGPLVAGSCHDTLGFKGTSSLLAVIAGGVGAVCALDVVLALYHRSQNPHPLMVLSLPPAPIRRRSSGSMA